MTSSRPAASSPEAADTVTSTPAHGPNQRERARTGLSFGEPHHPDRFPGRPGECVTGALPGEIAADRSRTPTTRTATRSVSVLTTATDALTAAALQRLSAEFPDCPRAAIAAVLACCQEQLSGAPLTALPELIERLARHRLTTETAGASEERQDR